MDAVKHAELSSRRIVLERDRAALRALSARPNVERELDELYRGIGEVCKSANANGCIRIEHWRNMWEYCLRTRCVGVVVRLEVFQEFCLVVSELDVRIPRIGEPSFPGRRPVAETTFIPYLNENEEFCWSRKGKESAFPSTAELAEFIVCRLVDLNEKKETNTLPPPLRAQTYGRQSRKSDSEEW
jgi:hypothetical protein